MKIPISNNLKQRIARLSVVLVYTISASAAVCAFAFMKPDGDAPTQNKKLQVVKNLTNIVVEQPQPMGQNKRPTFYANGVELEQFTVHMCGTELQDPNNPRGHIYKNVDPRDVYKLEFSADSSILLDQKLNPGNIIPVFHNSTPHSGTLRAAIEPDAGEPADFTVKDSQTRPALFIYDTTSNYFNLYSSVEGFHLGGLGGHNPSYAYQRFAKKDKSLPLPAGVKVPFHTFIESNKCFPDAESPTDGDTSINLYVLATPALQGSTDLPINVIARLDTPTITYTPARSLHFDLQESPTYDSSKVKVSTITQSNIHLFHQQQFFSFFSTWLDGENKTATENFGSLICTRPVGARFHGLNRYDGYLTKHGLPCHREMPKFGNFDCKESNCHRQVDLTTLESSSGIAFHDLYTDYQIMGKTCPHKSGALKGYYVFKPIMRSQRTSAHFPLSYYISYTGGVGAPFYIRDGGRNTSSSNTLGPGQPGVFYFFSYTVGITPSPGSKCRANTPAVVTGHDVYGNPVNLSVVMANGDQMASVN